MFKVGDKVVCQDTMLVTGLKLGDTYTVSGVDSGWLDFEEITGRMFKASHFRSQYPREKKVGTTPTPSESRKNKPLARGCLDYFPSALAAVAELSRIGNLKHNPGEEMHHARGKSSDHADCILRHLVDRGTIDPESGLSHSVSVAWRALALLQEELEAAGAPKARGAK